jgi:hypothetical protein
MVGLNRGEQVYGETRSGAIQGLGRGRRFGNAAATDGSPRWPMAGLVVGLAPCASAQALSLAEPQSQHVGSARQDARHHAAVRSTSTCRSQPSSWFQLAKMRLTIRLASILPSALSSARSWQAGLTSNALSEGFVARVEGPHPLPCAPSRRCSEATCGSATARLRYPSRWPPPTKRISGSSGRASPVRARQERRAAPLARSPTQHPPRRPGGQRPRPANPARQWLGHAGARWST